MPIFFIFVGFVLVAAAARGQEEKLLGILKDDFASDNNFVAWLAVIVILGTLGAAWKATEPFINAFLALVLVALVISQKGFLEKLKEQVLS